MKLFLIKLIVFLVPITFFCQTNKVSIEQLNDSIELQIRNRNSKKAKELISILSSKDVSSFEDRFLLNKNIFFYFSVK